MKAIKCNFKNVSNEDKSKFKTAQCLLLVNVGAEAHESDKLAATIELINGSFKSCIISLYDSLHRYSMAVNSNQEPNEFQVPAANAGKLWISRNEKYLDKLTIMSQIYHWDFWLNHPRYDHQKLDLQNLLKTDVTFKQAFETSVNDLLSRNYQQYGSKSNFNAERAKQLCFEQVLEECVVLGLWPELKCQYEISSENHSKAIEATREKMVKPFYYNNLNALTITYIQEKLLMEEIL